MNNLTKILLSVAVTLSLFSLLLSLSKPVREVVVGGVSSGSEYQSTTTRSHAGVALTDPTQLCPDGGGVLGSVVVTGANTGVLNFYNGTTTSNHSLYATTTLASLPASIAAGDYVYDVTASMGLIVDLDGGLMPTTTITYKCN